jgi:hypothetical protein
MDGTKPFVHRALESTVHTSPQTKNQIAIKIKNAHKQKENQPGDKKYTLENQKPRTRRRKNLKRKTARQIKARKAKPKNRNAMPPCKKTQNIMKHSCSQPFSISLLESSSSLRPSDE